MRNFDPILTAQLEKKVIQTFYLLELEFTQNYYYTDCDVPIYHDGHKYIPLGFTFDNISYTTEMTVDTVGITVDNLNKVFSGILLNEDVRNKVAIVSFGATIRDDDITYELADGVEFPNETGHIPLTAAQLSLVNGNAFADFNEDRILTDNVGKRVIIKNSTALSYYPPTQNATYVKATSWYTVDPRYYPHYATNPATSLIGGGGDDNSWYSNGQLNQRFHIDLGLAKVIDRIYYENTHWSGGGTDAGARHFTFWGSNSASAFEELTYIVDTNWTQITCSTDEFEQHVALDQADPKYINVNNNIASYRYYAFKFSDNWGSEYDMICLRRIELQNNRSATGYIKNSGTGETFNSEVITSWTNSDYNTFTSSGSSITSAIETGVSGSAKSNSFNTVKGELYKCVITLTLNSGQVPIIIIDDPTWSGTGMQLERTLVNGVNTIYFVSRYTQSAALYIRNTAASNWSCTFSIKEVLTPSSTGVTIVSELNGTTQNWESIETGFDYNNLNGYLFEIEDSSSVALPTKVGVYGNIVEELFRGFVGAWEIAGDKEVSLDINSEFIMWNKKVLRNHAATCQWTFRGTECSYNNPAASVWCDLSYDRCSDLGNSLNFGGFRFLPIIAEKEIWWGRTQG